MSKLLTIEEALSLLVNMDFIPGGETVLSIAEAFLEEATADYKNASNLDIPLRKRLKARMEVCLARCQLIHTLMYSLAEYELNVNDSLSEYDEDKIVGNPLLTRLSLAKWAYDRFGINIPNIGLFEGISIENVAKLEKIISDSNSKAPIWQDVTIKIQDNFMIRYSLDGAKWNIKSFTDIDMIDRSNNQPNLSGMILIGLSMKKMYPSELLEAKHKTAISKLSKKLNEMTRVQGSAFYIFNKGDGYKPKFKLIDDRRNADERAKKGVVHVSYDDHAETSNYDSYGVGKNEPGSEYLEKYDK